MSDRRGYHHGDLRAALLAAAEAELTDKGMEGFSLRSVAKRAGVSHAAPAHHFRDADGLLTALATVGLRRFLETQHRREAQADPAPLPQLLAAGLGYIDFAMENPALFRLIFASERPDFEHPELKEAADAAHAHLTSQVAACGGDAPDAAIVWAMAHGFADLLVTGRMQDLAALSPEARDQALVYMLVKGSPLHR